MQHGKRLVLVGIPLEFATIDLLAAAARDIIRPSCDHGNLSTTSAGAEWRMQQRLLR